MLSVVSLHLLRLHCSILSSFACVESLVFSGACWAFDMPSFVVSFAVYTLVGACFWAVFCGVFLVRTVAAFLLLVAFRCIVAESITLIALVDV